jgi:SAM-dependent methyltransferase
MGADALRRLRDGAAVEDEDFDDIFPDWARALSRIHFTPMRAALRATAWLAARAGARVLDVGSGAGKLCLVGALTTRGAFTGVELRPRLAALATEVARRCEIDRCVFVAGDALALDWRGYDGIYIYNPFAELLAERPSIDDALPRTAERFHAQVAGVEARLDAMPAGTRLVTYHGFGGQMPPGWNVVGAMKLDDGSLTFWMKSRD